MRALEARGAAIPGSRYVRDFCRECEEPIRVVVADGSSCCADCAGARARRERALQTDRRMVYLPEHGREGSRR